MIDEFIEVGISSHENQKERRSEALKAKRQAGDTFMVAELSGLGRNMLKILTIIPELAENGVNLLLVRQPELAMIGPQKNLLLAIYNYFAESERDFIALRTKQGLAATRTADIPLGRPKSRKNKVRRLDPSKSQIAH